MIKCKIDRHKKKMGYVNATGAMGDVRTETIFLIGEIYKGIKKKNPEVAVAYRNTLLAALMDHRSPLFAEEEPATNKGPEA